MFGLSEAHSAIALIFLGCCANNVFLELLVTRDPGCGHLITLVQFAAIAAAYRHVAFHKRQIPLTYYAAQVGIFFTVSLVNNAVFDYDIPITLHMIFRSGSLIANVVLGFLLLRRRVAWPQLAGVALVTLGVALVTLADASARAGSDVPVSAAQWRDLTHSVLASSRMLTGVAMLTAALLLSALLGILQEYTYRRFGKHAIEALFYSHALSLPLFAAVARDITGTLTHWRAKEPDLFLLLAGNALTQLVCITGVFRLTGAAGSLSMTLTISLRKFVSLLISVVYFANPFSRQHWLGTTAVFAGTLLYSLAPRATTQRTTEKRKTQ